jgi:hypothetical protein
MAEVQVKISNVANNTNNTKILAIKASVLLSYLQRLINESNTKYQPNNSKKYDHLPILAVVDLVDTQEEYVFSENELPTEDVVNSKGVVLLKILDEADVDDMRLVSP